MGVLGALSHGPCETTMVPEGQWTVCNDGFSLLERGHAPVAWALHLQSDEGAVAKAERSAAAAREAIDHPVEDSDCGPYPCSSYLRNHDDPERDAYLHSLSDAKLARLDALIRAWEHQESKRELEEARAGNTTLHERLKQIAAYEAELDRTKALARVDAKSLHGPEAEE
jgi:multidrug efflux pump subunit AcrA (membrane-fusion protein)